MAELECLQKRFAQAADSAGVTRWQARSLVVCPARFNALTDSAGTKSAVLAHGFVRLLADAVAATQGDSLHVHVDKQGGRNTYAAQVQQALPGGMVLAVEEGALRSVYRVAGLGRDVTLTFQPRADARLPVRGAGVDGQQVPARTVHARVQPLLADAHPRPEADGRLPRRRAALPRSDPAGGGEAEDPRRGDLATTVTVLPLRDLFAGADVIGPEAGGYRESSPRHCRRPSSLMTSVWLKEIADWLQSSLPVFKS